jgi:hypothetical protein
MSILTFDRGQETDYAAWVRRRGGYVLTQRPQDSARFMIHDAECTHLEVSGDWAIDGPRRCCERFRPLADWAREQSGSEPLRCQSCF